MYKSREEEEEEGSEFGRVVIKKKKKKITQSQDDRGEGGKERERSFRLSYRCVQLVTESLSRVSMGGVESPKALS